MEGSGHPSAKNHSAVLFSTVLPFCFLLASLPGILGQSREHPAGLLWRPGGWKGTPAEVLGSQGLHTFKSEGSAESLLRVSRSHSPSRWPCTATYLSHPLLRGSGGRGSLTQN